MDIKINFCNYVNSQESVFSVITNTTCQNTRLAKGEFNDLRTFSWDTIFQHLGQDPREWSKFTTRMAPGRLKKLMAVMREVEASELPSQMVEKGAKVAQDPSLTMIKMSDIK